MKIRKATQKDVDGIFEVLLELMESEDKSAHQTSPYLKKMRSRRSNFKTGVKKDISNDIKDKKKLYLVVTDNKKVAAYLLCSFLVTKDVYFRPLRLGYLNAMCISKTHRGKGLATKLYKECLKWYKTKKVTHLSLEVFSQNPAINIYKKWGFVPTVQKMWKKL